MEPRPVGLTDGKQPALFRAGFSVTKNNRKPPETLTIQEKMV
jgi:hypothetical protein